ncbi:50S ribosomal protein L3 [Candidatus Tremblaya princeps]|uniref:50S ribosomal protein L3 n=1 Tax=Tremblaya princeps TaxID=189385 RepID=A0A143WPE9_TREPR|nr:50S ribosomal protein L3 [Candidatus Tremblaya princeps]
MRGSIMLGVKVGMTRISRGSGGVVPVTVLDVSCNTPLRNACRSSAKLVVLYRRANSLRLARPQLCSCLGRNMEPAAYAARPAQHGMAQHGIPACGRPHAKAMLRAGQIVTIRARSVGKGFSGVMKRHGFRSGRASHGSSKAHRTLGSTGMSQDPGRVLPGKRMPGRMGCEQATARNLMVEHVAHDFVMVRGGIPGHAGSIVAILP